MIHALLAIGLAIVLLAMAISRPEWLSNNAFLASFITHEALALMAIILTVTLAAVGNIIVSINRLIARVDGASKELKQAASEAKRQIKRSAWLIFYGFIIAVVVMFVKGLSTEDSQIIAVCNGIILWLIGLYCLALHDIYAVMFEATERDHEM